MPLFQKSVINKYLKNLDNEKVNKAFENFQKFYGDKLRLYNIMQLKEENYQEGFLREIFAETLGYTINPDKDFNLTTEFKNFNDARKADGAILRNGKAVGVIELKSTKTKNLESIKEQAFSYKNNQPGCRYIITSNFQNLRFYIDDATEYEEFNLFSLSEKDFKLFYLLLSKESIFSDLPHKLKKETKFHESDISAQLYTDYKRFKNKIFENLVKNNPQYDKLTLFKKSQKLLDRFLFVFFAEDSGLIPPNAVSKIIEQWKQLQELDEYRPLYTRFQKLFSHLDKGHKYEKWGEIPAYNGGLFRNDELLDSNELKIDDEVLEKDSLILSAYDFNTEVDVDILGHIFEHSLNEIENITAQLRGEKIDKKKTKRKKDGIFYTPKYITKYIVENTVGTLCKEKKEELKINNILIDETFHRKSISKGYVRLTEKGKKLFKTLNEYKDWLLTLKILDPACGSGAFLNATLDFLIQEHKQIADIIAELMGDASPLFTEIDKAILENNIYGVDINEESVEIAKLSLWLRTAQKGRPLSDLSGNIKCGNSLIDDPEVAGDKAFHWQTEFPQIFTDKKKKAWHITTATHNSRYSQRMFDNNVKTGKAIWLDEKDEIIITKTVAEIVKKDNLNVVEYNICGDHMHLLLVCEEEELTRIVGKIKSMTSRSRNIERGYTIPKKSESTTTRGQAPLSASMAIPPEKETKNSTPLPASKTIAERGETQTKLWTQKFGKSEIKNKNYLNNAIKYIRNNRIKHELPENKETEKIKKEFLCTAEHAFRPEYKGGFDVVLGNPPYVGQTKDSIYKNYKWNSDLYLMFFEKIFTEKILKTKGIFSFITPRFFAINKNCIDFRKFLLEKVNLTKLVETTPFKDAETECLISVINNSKSNSKKIIIEEDSNTEIKSINKISKEYCFKNNYIEIQTYLTENIIKILEKISNSTVLLKSISISKRGMEIGKKDFSTKNTGVKVLVGYDTTKYLIQFKDNYVDVENPQYKRLSSFFANDGLIFLRRVASGLIASLSKDYKYSFNKNIYGIKVKEKFNNRYILCLLNSTLLDFYYKKRFSTKKIDLFPEIQSYLFQSLPIKEISKEAQQPFIEKADKMLLLNKQLQQKKTKFLNRVRDNLWATAPDNGANSLDLKLSKKTENFYDYDFKTFVSELKKKKIKLSLTEQDEWEDYFNTYKTEINNLQAEISETDKEIDKMVYKLYELTDEEIEIVENSVK